MGISGLLPFVKKAQTKCHVRKFSGCTVAIDAYSWLHKGAFGCAEKLGKGEPTTAYITYCLKYINVLLSHNIKPVLVLDGRNLISKSHTEKARRTKREENRKNAKEFLRKGMKKQAWECFTRCIDITPAMAREFIKTLRDMKLDYIVAPYEADAQMAYLARKNIVDIIITEDSDLILFGCPKIFFKMSVLGDGVLFDQSKLPMSLGLKAEQFQFERFRWMAIMSGCDYLPSLPGIGLVRAKKVITGTTTNDLRKLVLQIPNLLNNVDVDVTEEYIEGFIRAENTFLYQLVFDPIKKRLLPLTPYPADFDHNGLDYAGFYEEKQLALQMALGNVDIHTLKKVDNFDPLRPNSGYNETSMWSPNFKISSVPRLITARDMKKNAKHSPTIGMQVNVSVRSSLNKRSLLADAAEFKKDRNTSNDEQLISMYSVKDEPTQELDYSSLDSLSEPLTGGSMKKRHCRKSEPTCTDGEDTSSFDSLSEPCTEQTKKRIRLDNSEEEDFDFKDKSKTNKKNPFLKSSRITRQTNSTETNASLMLEKTPLCVIEKNKVYEDDNVIVKSHYFRDADGDSKRPTIKFEIDQKKSNFQLNLQESEDEEEEDLKLKVENVDNVDSSQMSIYSIDRGDSQKLSDKKPRRNADFDDVKVEDVITLLSDDEGKNDDLSQRELKFRLRSSPAPKKMGRSNSKSNGLMGPCRRVGLSRNISKNNVDPKQKTISAMFALQQKPKL